MLRLGHWKVGINGVSMGCLLLAQVIGECKPGGLISPQTCEYYQRWLEF